MSYLEYLSEDSRRIIPTIDPEEIISRYEKPASGFSPWQEKWAASEIDITFQVENLISWEPSENDITSQIENLILLLSENNINIPDGPSITEYLYHNFDIIEVVKNMCLEVPAYFKSETVFFLELFLDPESDDKYLTLQVRQENYDPDIMKKIDKIWDDFDEQLVGKSGWILVTTDFQPPK